MLLLLLVGCSMRSRAALAFVSAPMNHRVRSIDSAAYRSSSFDSSPLPVFYTIKTDRRTIGSGDEEQERTQASFQNDDTTDVPPVQHTVTWLMPMADTTAEGLESSTPSTQQTNALSFPVLHGETLRTASLRRGIASPHNARANLINCRGLGTCGTCAVHIVEGTVDPPTQNAVETIRLQLPPHSNKGGNRSNTLRLACQVQVIEDVTVEKRSGFWGQHEDIVAPTVPEKYFGQLEYVLDTKSPPPPTAVDDRE